MRQDIALRVGLLRGGHISMVSRFGKGLLAGGCQNQDFQDWRIG